MVVVVVVEKNDDKFGFFLIPKDTANSNGNKIM
jgi:hypothetical protein